jgi:hypothetical protein
MLLVIVAMIADFNADNFYSEDWWMKSHDIVFVVVLVVFNFNVMVVRRKPTALKYSWSGGTLQGKPRDEILGQKALSKCSPFL